MKVLLFSILGLVVSPALAQPKPTHATPNQVGEQQADTAWIVQNQLRSMQTLLGTWQVAGKEQYEMWRWADDRQSLTGEGYTLVNGEKKVLETLCIRVQQGTLVYEATVPNQNEGATVTFRHSPDENTHLAFANPTHDFPKQIAYYTTGPGQLKVRVSGDNGEGFSITLNKLNP